jgi:hypothetical protein
MVKFAVGARPVVTTTPTVVVDALPTGTHVFRLVVVDDTGLQSKPTEVAVTIGGLEAGPNPDRPVIGREQRPA